MPRCFQGNIALHTDQSLICSCSDLFTCLSRNVCFNTLSSVQILERSIKLLFETRDISQVKRFVQRQCAKVLDGGASMQDLTFAKEYRGSGSYRPGACVPALELTRWVCQNTHSITFVKGMLITRCCSCQDFRLTSSKKGQSCSRFSQTLKKPAIIPLKYEFDYDL